MLAIFSVIHNKLRFAQKFFSFVKVVDTALNLIIFFIVVSSTDCICGVLLATQQSILDTNLSMRSNNNQTHKNMKN